MQIQDILSVDQIECAYEAQSKKSALERIAELLSEANTNLSREAIFDHLIQRERLGSTGLGSGIAIPHSRVANNEETVAVFLKTNKAVDYDAPDSQPVDVFFSLLVPEEATEEHLNILSKLAEKFRNESLLNDLRRTNDKERIFRLLTDN